MYKNIGLKLSLLLIVIGLSSCKSTRINKRFVKKITHSFYNNQFTGVFVYNPRTKDTVFSYNATKYFTPASNTKIVTLFTGLQILKDSIPAFKYRVFKDTISIIGTGNPTFLHPYFKDSTLLKMVKKYKNVQINFSNISDDAFAPGWAWEDYDAYFSPQRSAMPFFGNMLTVSNKDSLLVYPSFLIDKVQITNKKFKRHLHKNEFYYPPKRTKKTEIPLNLEPVFQQQLWRNLIPNVTFTNQISKKKYRTVYIDNLDALYQRMMHLSDNFLAEQILIMASSALSDTLSSSNIRKKILANNLRFLKHKPRWVDGSGLSRYNLFTPTSLVQILDKMYAEIPQKRLFNIFPSGINNTSYIYAKSGSLSNNYSLSGYLITKKGEILIFSFMNNHYQKPTKEVKRKMFEFLEMLQEY